MTKHEPGISVLEKFRQLEEALYPWLGKVRVFNLPANACDITTLVRGIKGHGFTWLEWHKEKPGLPAWSLRPNRIRDSGVYCSTAVGRLGYCPPFTRLEVK
jgi:hypothetical protein